MPAKKKYATSEERCAERNRRRREQYAASKLQDQGNACMGISAVATTAIKSGENSSGAVDEHKGSSIMQNNSILPFVSGTPETSTAANAQPSLNSQSKEPLTFDLDNDFFGIADDRRSHVCVNKRPEAVKVPNSSALLQALKNSYSSENSENIHLPAQSCTCPACERLKFRANLSAENARSIKCASSSLLHHNHRISRINDGRVLHQRGVTQASTPNDSDPLQCFATEATRLPNVPDCAHCGAKRFHQEPPGFCCASGDIQLVQTEMPLELMLLYLEDSAEAEEFRNCVRSYNNMFAFTSIGVHSDKSLARRNHGIYTFRVQGQMYHFINPLVPTDGEKPKNLQLYFFDTEHETTNRLTISSKFRESLVTKLSEILKINPYSAFFRGLQDLPDIQDYKVVLESNPNLDQRVFNKPTVSQVGAIWDEADNSEQVTSQHIQVYDKNGKTQIVKHYFSCYDSLQYPLIFAHAEPGWHPGIERLPQRRNISSSNDTCSVEKVIDLQKCCDADEVIGAEMKATNKKRKRNSVSCREYYCYKLQMRAQDKSMLLHVGRLLQQYVVAMYIKIETSRLDFYRNQDNQSRLRTELYQGLLDSISRGETSTSNVGKRIILPGSFIGGPRDMKRRYMDAMSLVQKYGKPDLFLTITCNQNWPEIKEHLLPKEFAQNRPDLLARVFRAKLEVLKHELFKKHILGKVAAYTYVVEFQKRGFPHAHFLIILRQSSKMFAPEAYDRIVCAELPDPVISPHLYTAVVKHMMHGPCGNMNPECPCMQKSKRCKDNYPKSFSECTKHSHNSYPVYRRRNNKRTIRVRGFELDNRWVIPYNAYLLSRFNCHLNVEICSTVEAVKYIYKYIYKGHDKVMYQLSPGEADQILDEIKSFQSARWVSPPEAMWRIFAFDLNEIHPSVITLPVHLDNHQPISFHEKQSVHNVVKNDAFLKTMLTEFFAMNKYDDYAKSLNCLYTEFPEHFVWQPQSRHWEKRKKREAIGRILGSHPSEGERYYLRMLLMHIRGPISFDSLKTVNGQMASSFQEAAYLLGLLQNDNSAECCLQEVILYTMPTSLRQLFATVLIHCSPKNPKQLWFKFKTFLSEDMEHNPLIPKHLVEVKILQSIDASLRSMGKHLSDFDLPQLPLVSAMKERDLQDIDAEKNIVVLPEDLLMVQQLNEEQKKAYDIILDCVNNNKSGAFFVDGPGGTGKTFLYKALLATIRSKRGIALATATSGVAASILPGGRTAHSRFKIPLYEDNHKSCNVSKQSPIAQLIRQAKLIIWDEATMAKRKAIETFDQMLRDVMSKNDIFGGKIVLFGGDFRQTLPVISKGQKQHILDASLVMSPLWNQFQKLRLQKNMRAQLDPDFSAFLLRVGDGNEPVTINGEIKIPASLNIPFVDDASSMNALIDTVFPDIKLFATNPESIVNRAILMTRNDFVHDINQTLIEKFPGEQRLYLSFDEMLDCRNQPEREDLLHTLTPKGLPCHELKLKINCPIMLLRNLNPAEGLSNGTRLICKAFTDNVIHAQIAFGSFCGKCVFIPRIPLECSNDEFCLIPFKRTQFPVRLCFAMTINKAQGQTLDFVGLYLKEPVFSHGQLYVALSRVKTAKDVKVLIRPVTPLLKGTDLTKNVVYQEVLSAVAPQ